MLEDSSFPKSRREMADSALVREDSQHGGPKHLQREPPHAQWSFGHSLKLWREAQCWNRGLWEDLEEDRAAEGLARDRGRPQESIWEGEGLGALSRLSKRQSPIKPKRDDTGRWERPRARDQEGQYEKGWASVSDWSRHRLMKTAVRNGLQTYST